jgi:hypothetical protein
VNSLFSGFWIETGSFFLFISPISSLKNTFYLIVSNGFGRSLGFPMIKRKTVKKKKTRKRKRPYYSNRRLSYEEFCAFQNNFHLVLVGGRVYYNVLSSVGLSLGQLKKELPKEFAVVKNAWRERMATNKKIKSDREKKFGTMSFSKFSLANLEAYAEAKKECRNAFYRKAQKALYSFYCFLRQSGLSNSQLSLDPNLPPRAR